MRRTGYLASLLNHPPLIFRFQFNPEIFSEKKAHKYAEVQAPGQLGFDKFEAASGFFASAAGLWKDLKEVGPRLLNVKPLQASEGAPREFALDFRLDGTTPGPLDGDSHYGGSIEPDLATLRSFMDPNYSFIDYYDAIRGKAPCWKRPPGR